MWEKISNPVNRQTDRQSDRGENSHLDGANKSHQRRQSADESRALQSSPVVSIVRMGFDESCF